MKKWFVLNILLLMILISSAALGSTAVLRPNSQGYYASWSNLGCSSGINEWQCIDEILPSTTDYTYTSGNGRETFKFSNLNLTSEAINSVTLYYYSMQHNNPNNACFGAITRTNGIDYLSGNQLCTNSIWDYQSHTYTLNPATETAWTSTEINNLEAGMYGLNPHAGGRIAQVYAVVDYTEAPAFCGNNVVESGEVCDGTALGGQTCALQGFTGGTLGCNSDCGSFETSGCYTNSCSDTDGGIISETQGNVSGNFMSSPYSSTDYCLSSTLLFENYCNGNINRTAYINCANNLTNSCSNGACVYIPSICADGLDNDNDGLIDYPNDPGCSSSNDVSELGTAACDNGIDETNDADTLADYRLTGGDPGCASAIDTNERDGSCDDTLDNDGDGFRDFTSINFTADPECSSYADVEYECSDSDGGYTSAIQGTVSGSFGGIPFLGTDFCVDSATLTEYWCNNNMYSSYINCVSNTTNQCVNGACVLSPAFCGNNIVESGEVCDGTNLNGQTCASQGFSGGTLGCSSDCGSYETSGCYNNTCSDTDGGDAPLVQGTVSGSYQNVEYNNTDACFTGTMLTEYICMGKLNTYITVNCATGNNATGSNATGTNSCSNGACV